MADIRKRTKRRYFILFAAGAVALLFAAVAVYYWTQTDPRLQPHTPQKEVSRLLGSEGTTVFLDRPPADLPNARYYVFYPWGPDLFGTSRVVTVYYDRDGWLLRYEVAVVPR
jgi:hypothetical protein